jgi:hypothetical protein
MRISFLLILLFLLTASCSSLPRGDAGEQVAPPAPDYANPDAWAALPQRADNADRTPVASLPDNQSTAPADVFFLHPTTYTGERGQKQWNAPVTDPALNAKTDKGTILYQASIFNGAGRVYAPRYRQAHLHAYFTKDNKKPTAIRAFEVAYRDVRAAFEYYLEHYNEGRPIIIAAHSQGTTHAKQLLRDFFDGKPLQERLVAAYLVGIPVENGYLVQIPPCELPDDTGCYCSWRSFRKGHTPQYHLPGGRIVATNPLLWNTGSDYAPAALNEGAVLRDFNKILPQLADAQVHDGLLWVTKPKFPGSIFFTRPNYHIADYNFYYMNVRNNAILRAEAYFKNR